MSEQLFHHGDLVRIDKALPGYMSHFTMDRDAIVIASYSDKFGGSMRREPQYTIHIEGSGQVSWYQQSILTLIEHNCSHMLEVWEAAAKKLHDKESDLDWIFENGASVLDSASGSTTQALWDLTGLGSIWGSRGEGVTAYANARTILALAAPYLLKGDREGFEAKCAEVRHEMEN